MYFEKAKLGNNRFWTYLVTIILVLVFSQLVGGLPVAIIIGLNAVNKGGSSTTGGEFSPQAFGVDPNLFLVLMMIPFVIGLVGLWIGVRSVHKKRFEDVLTGRDQFDFKKVLYGAGLWAGLWLIYMVASVIIDGDSFQLQFNPSMFIILFVVAIVMIPLQSAFEEILFRGYIMQGISLISKNKWVPLLVTSILFGGLHVLNPEVKEYGMAIMLPQYIFFGLVFGIVVIMDEGLELVIGVHAINNILNALFVTHDSCVFQTSAVFKVINIYPAVDFIVLILMSILFITIASRKYKWKNWKSLFQKVSYE